MSHILSQDVLDFNTMLTNTAKKEKKLFSRCKQLNDNSTKLEVANRELLFSDLEKQMNMNSVQIPTNFLSDKEQKRQNFTNNAQLQKHDEFDINSTLNSRSQSRDSSHLTNNYDSSPESNFPYTPIDSLESCTTDSNTDDDLVKNLKDDLFNNTDSLENHFNNTISNDLYFDDNMLNKEIEQIISAPVEVQIDSVQKIENDSSNITDSHNLESLKRTNENLELSTDFEISSKRRKIVHLENLSSDTEIEDNNKFLKCFSVLRTNYISLCESYNDLLDKLEFTESENRLLVDKFNQIENEKEQWKIDKDRVLLEREDMKSMLDGLLHEVTVLRHRERKNKVRSTIGEMMIIKDE